MFARPLLPQRQSDGALFHTESRCLEPGEGRGKKLHKKKSVGRWAAGGERVQARADQIRGGAVNAVEDQRPAHLHPIHNESTTACHSRVSNAFEMVVLFD